MLPAVSRPFRDRAQGRRFVIQSEGRVLQKPWGGYHTGAHARHHTPPPSGGGRGRSRRMYPCGKAPRPASGPDDQAHRAARCLTHSSAPSWSSTASAPWPRGRGRVPHRPIPHQHVADLVRPDGRQSRAPVAPSRVAAFAYGGRPGDRHRRSPSPGQNRREHEPRMADNSRAWTLYRRGDFRLGRLR